MNGFMKNNLSRTLLFFVATLLLPSAHAISFFKDYHPEVVVSDPYIELRTGPGRGFPIFYVAGQGDTITILKSKTDWYKVQVSSPREKLAGYTLGNCVIPWIWTATKLNSALWV